MNEKNELYVSIDITRDCTLIAVLIMVATTARVYSFQVRDAADHLVNYYLMPIAALKPNLCVGCNRLSRLFINCLGALQAALARGLQLCPNCGAKMEVQPSSRTCARVATKQEIKQNGSY